MNQFKIMKLLKLLTMKHWKIKDIKSYLTKLKNKES
jgi:hypothetical protein